MDGAAPDGRGAERLAEEYVLIGDVDDGTCGHNWLTWGNPVLGTDDGDDVPPHVADGYERADLRNLSALQFSRFDCEQSSESTTESTAHPKNGRVRDLGRAAADAAERRIAADDTRDALIRGRGANLDRH